MLNIYNPKNFTLLDLSICEDLKISINTPVILDNTTSSLYDSLMESGYNLFNQNDSFYNDICSTYTTENGTDINLNDRKQIIYNNYANISLCQIGCQFESYNSSSKKAKCECSPQTNETDENLNLNTILDNFCFEKITESFISTFKYSNFIVLKCYKLAFDFKDILKNIGRIIMTIIIVISSAFFIVFCICDFKKIDGFLKGIYKIKLKYINKQNNDKINNKKLNNESNKNINISKISKSKKSISKFKTKTEGDILLNDKKKNKNKNNDISNTKQKKSKFAPPKKGIKTYKNKDKTNLKTYENITTAKKIL